MSYANYTDNAKSYLEKILAILDIEAEVLEEGIDENTICYRINCRADDARILIGRNGQTLDSLQFVVRQMCRSGGAEQKPFLIDILDYRSRRQKNLEEQAKKAAVAILNGESDRIDLPSMSPYERRIVHQYLQINFPDLISQSQGEGVDRHIVLSFNGLPENVEDEGKKGKELASEENIADEESLVEATDKTE